MVYIAAYRALLLEKMSLYITISIEFIFIENFEYQILPYASEYQKNKFLSRNNIRWIVSPKVFFIAY